MYEENLKQAAMQQGLGGKSYYGECATPSAPTPPTILGMAGRLGDNQCCRVSIAEEIARRIHHTRERSNELSRLEHLALLAAKNPDMLKMIELMRDLGLLH